MSWTEEKVNKLKELWGKGGHTASQIATIIGGISRNAVIGKAHRLNLSAGIGHFSPLVPVMIASPILAVTGPSLVATVCTTSVILYCKGIGFLAVLNPVFERSGFFCAPIIFAYS